MAYVNLKYIFVSYFLFYCNFINYINFDHIQEI